MYMYVNTQDRFISLSHVPITYVNTQYRYIRLFHSAVPILLPRELNLKEYVKAQDQPEPVYDLFAVSNHFGGMGGGHCES